MTVHWVETRALAVQNPRCDALDGGERGSVKIIDVRRVGQVTETIAEGGRAAVALNEGYDLDVANLEGAVHGPGDELRLVPSMCRGAGRKGVSEPRLDRRQILGPAVSVEWPPDDSVDGAEIIDSVSVIRVFMGEQDSVKSASPGVEELGAQVGRSIDQEGGSRRRRRGSRRACDGCVDSAIGRRRNRNQ